jgi:PIN domain nuclease of toxin-antitoxin system
MPLLLDTCAAIFASEDSLAPQGVDALDRAYASDEPVFMSPITAWEVALLAAKGRLASPLSPLAWFERFTRRPDIRLVDLSPPILVASCFLPAWKGRDPADRIIVASAREMGLTLMTRDSSMLNYADAGYVLATPC